MRKQTKWAVILGAAAVMTFGACMTSFAATGWVQEDGSWYYYTSDDEAVTETWKKSTDGKSYWLGVDGEMVTDSWVDYDSNKYYVDSQGARITSGWKYTYGMDDDSAEEESWFWFDANGKMATTKKAINGKTYYFNEDGQMLTGWINKETSEELDDTAVDGNSVYCLEDGTRATGWLQAYDPDDSEEEDLYWYNFSSTGSIRVNKKQTINGKSYTFDNEGKMLTGWVYTTGSDSFVSADEDFSNTAALPENATSGSAGIGKFLYAGNSNDGAVKKATWVKTVQPGKDTDDVDLDAFWYYLANDGVPYFAGGSNVGVGQPARKVLAGTLNTDTNKVYASLGIKKVGTKYYAFNNLGQMVHGLILLEDDLASYNSGVYYFGKENDGAFKTGSVSLANDDGVSYSYYFATAAKDATSTTEEVTKGQGVTGVYSSKLYQNGLALTAEEGSTYQVVCLDVRYNATAGSATTSKFYIVNEAAKVMTGGSYTADNGEKYGNVKLGNDTTTSVVKIGDKVTGPTGTANLGKVQYYKAIVINDTQWNFDYANPSFTR